VEKRDIDLSKALNTAGEHEVVVHLGYKVKSTVKVKISGKTEEGAERGVRGRKSRKSESEEQTDRTDKKG
jgi:predicted lipid-binding transport protein (Tim44 family)